MNCWPKHENSTDTHNMIWQSCSMFRNMRCEAGSGRKAPPATRCWCRSAGCTTSARISCWASPALNAARISPGRSWRRFGSLRSFCGGRRAEKEGRSGVASTFSFLQVDFVTGKSLRFFCRKLLYSVVPAIELPRKLVWNKRKRYNYD